MTLWHALLEKVTNFKCVGFLSVTEVKLKAYSRGHRCVLNNLFHECRVGYEMVHRQREAYNHFISNKCDWNNCFIKKAHEISRILPDLICKNNQFQLVFKFEQTRTFIPYLIWRAW